MKNSYFFTFLIFCVTLLIGCNPKEKKNTNSLVISFKHTIGNTDLQLGGTYVSPQGETFTISKLDYFISNIRLQKADGSEYVMPQDNSYFLVKLSEPASQNISLVGVPAGEYTSIKFVIGVDSLRNTLEPARRTGALDVGAAAEGMYWNWNTGYIFLKLEGTSPAAPAAQNNEFLYHIGGYGGYLSPTINNVRTCGIAFGTSLRVADGKKPILHLKTDLAKLFKNKTTISIAQNSSVMFSPFSATIADNYLDMFSLDFVHN